MTKRSEELDVLRAVAALAVTGTHYTTMCRDLGTLESTFHWGIYGPPLFFVISGFVILMTVRKSPHALDFVVSRISRIYPAYWLAVPIALIAFRYFPLPGDEATVGQALVNLTMLQTWLRVEDLDGVYWTLAIELKFYALMLIVILLRGVDRIELFAGAWLCAIAAYWNLDLQEIAIPNLIRTPLNVDYGALFVGGVFFYLIKTDGGTWYRHACIAASVLVQGIAMGFEAALMTVAFYGLFYLFVYEKLGWIAQRPLVQCGVVSYAFYLLHCPVGNIVMTTLLPVTRSPLLLSFASFAMALALAFGVTYFVEKPIQRVVRRKYDKVRERRQASAVSLSPTDALA